MRIKKLILKNFRSYNEETEIEFNDLTAIIGKNDSGKSTIMEALEIFFNNKLVKIDSLDSCVYNADSKEAIISCIFDDLPDSIIIDAAASTNLRDEFLVLENGDFQIVKKFNLNLKTPSVSIFINAFHPNDKKYSDLLSLKNDELKKRAESLKIDTSSIDLRINSDIRKAIWNSNNNLTFSPTELKADKEDAKKIWEQIEKNLPLFALFQSDRPSKDDDSEVQDPMKLAIDQAMEEIADEIDVIKKKVMEKSILVAKKTLEKLAEIDSALSSDLIPTFKAEPKWDSIFKLSLTGDDSIPVNKRGSGVRRLILLSFFRAEAERKKITNKTPSVIYAIEEPETSQHPNYQKLLINSLNELSQNGNTQIILTTHNPSIASLLPLSSIRYIKKENKEIQIQSNTDAIYKTISDELGIISANLNDVKLIVCVEGPTDIIFLKFISSILNQSNNSYPDLNNHPKIIILPLGGGTLKQWVENNYLKHLNIPEFHLYDRDADNKYEAHAKEVNNRKNNSFAVLTKKRELENYIHTDCITESIGINISFNDQDDVGKILAKALHDRAPDGNPWEQLKEDSLKKKISRAKGRIINEALPKMTLARLKQIDVDDEVINWFDKMKTYL